uniref:Transporter n=1 Tax=Proboscia inermis TaxID=420281 RepID=A0A7S0CJ52_9STRA|mmetsp:Transcript_50835/g.51239  ORF Transcript_50835/g.51239 Transcript_50835/m.51239 type:complete len:588 (+) Transcript_50835:288-2051(+)
MSYEKNLSLCYCTVFNWYYIFSHLFSLISKLTGQFYQSGDCGVFMSMNKRLAGTGLASVSCSFFVTLYYVPLIAWVLNAFFDTFSDYAWDGSQDEKFDGTTYVLDTVIGGSTVTANGFATRIAPANVGYLFLSWVCVYCCIAFGVKVEGYITYFTMGFPIILLFMFLIICANLPGSSDGIRAYIWEWDLNVLTERPEVWSTAVSQIFFSIGVTFGIMTAFGSHCDRNAPAVENSIIIALLNSFFSFIAGFMVFSAVGALATKKGVDISDVDVGGFSLVFGTVPEVLDGITGGKHLVRLFFLFLFLLGIDSAFALTESAVTVICDTSYCAGKPRKLVAGGVCFVGFLVGLLYVTDAGLSFLDVVDYYVNFIMMLVGFFECYAVGWAFDIDKQVASHGLTAVVLLNTGTFVSVFVASFLWFAGDESYVLGGWLALIFIYLAYFKGVVLSLKDHHGAGMDMKSELYDLYFGNITTLCDTLRPVVGFLPLIWAIFIKLIIAPLLLLLFINLAFSGNFGVYGGYAVMPYQFLGYISIAIPMLIFLAGVFVPSIYSGFNAAKSMDDIVANDEKDDEKTEKKLMADNDTEGEAA